MRNIQSKRIEDTVRIRLCHRKKNSDKPLLEVETIIECFSIVSVITLEVSQVLSVYVLQISHTYFSCRYAPNFLNY